MLFSQKYLFTLLFCFVLSTACMRQAIYDVEGEITLDGKPLDSGFIVFFGKGGQGRKEGARIENGHYVGKVAPGVNLVKIQGFASIEKPIPDPEFPGSFIRTKQITKDELHWENPRFLLKMNAGKRDIRLKSDPESPFEN